MNVHGASRVGSRRDANEDAFLALPLPGLLLVVDGVGAGSGAAADVVEAFRAAAAAASERELAEPRLWLQGVFRRANKALVERSAADGRARCAAAVVVLARGGRLTVGWCGDCRACLAGAARRGWLTRDHTRLQELLDRSVIAPGEVDPALRKSALTRTLGAQDEPREEYLDELPAAAGDRLLLCSDGVSDVLDEAAVLKLLRAAASPAAAVAAITEAAQANGAVDDTTAVVAFLGEEDLAARMASGVADQALTAAQRELAVRAGPSPAAAAPRSVSQFLRSLPAETRSVQVREALVLGALLAAALLAPELLKLVGRRLDETPLTWFAAAALVLYLVLLPLRLR